MPINDLRHLSMADVPNLPASAPADWLWHGYLAPGTITLLTSTWMAGKTTLLTGFLRHMGTETRFLGQKIRPGQVLVLSEESRSTWSHRLRLIPVADHARLLLRPFKDQPSVDEWSSLIDHVRDLRQHGTVDLVAIDSLRPFLPAHDEADAAALRNLLKPLQRLTDDGIAVLLMEKRRRLRSDEDGGRCRKRDLAPSLRCVRPRSRNRSEIWEFADIVLELDWHSRRAVDLFRRRITIRTGHSETPARVAYEWNQFTGQFIALPDPRDEQFESNWSKIQSILESRPHSFTHKELLTAWPADSNPPSPSTLYEWLNRAKTENRIEREGRGTSDEPWRYGVIGREEALTGNKMEIEPQAEG